ncbi:hypothetical protein OCOJLMKI_1731 [Methylobacterium iners]|uniref:Uncharacterized protein n=1 Tax=Methylobacterium iners TaxID=418707 RepID=A0ABQ4RWF6_9HYPH|nr:hypothetical protein OCOJLMKI_1731 [Methylobacterium iners]
MTRVDTISFSAGIPCMVLGPIWPRIAALNPAERLGVAVLTSGVVVGWLLLALRKR